MHHISNGQKMNILSAYRQCMPALQSQCMSTRTHQALASAVVLRGRLVLLAVVHAPSPMPSPVPSPPPTPPPQCPQHPRPRLLQHCGIYSTNSTRVYHAETTAFQASLPHPALLAFVMGRMHRTDATPNIVYLRRSHDDGATWGRRACLERSSTVPCMPAHPLSNRDRRCAFCPQRRKLGRTRLFCVS